MKLIGAVLVLSLLGYIEVKPLIKSKRKKEAIVYSCILLLGLIISIMLIRDVEIPSPSRAIEKVVSSILKR